MNIALIGGHGKVALLAAPLLAQAGHRVDAIIRNPDHEADVLAAGANPVVADVETLDTTGLIALLRGHDVVIWSAGAGGGSPERTLAVDRDAAIRTIDAAQALDTRLFVMVSYFGARSDHGVDPGSSFHTYAEAKAAADAHLRQSELAYTILMPSTLTDDAATGSIDIESDTAARVSRGNVARVIAATVEQVVDGVPAAVDGLELRFNDGPTPIAEAFTTLARRDG